MKRYVVIYKVTETILVGADSEEQARTRALAVLHNGRPDREVEIVQTNLYGRTSNG